MSYPTPPQQPYPPPAPPPVPRVPQQRNRRALQIAGVVVAVLAAFGVGAVVGAAAAGGDGDGGNEARPAATVTVTADPGGKAGDGGDARKADDAAEAEQAGDDSFALTETAVYETGFEVVLSDFERATSGEYAAPAGTPYVKFELTLTNGSEERLDLNGLLVGCQYGDQGRSGEQIFDEGLDTPTTHLRPGRSIDVSIGCELPTGESYVQIEVTPDWESETAIFAGRID
ncbi:hypothetical protein [Streptomyces phytophilus]|uniref:hypothetical protein n=1 Tax=Streptomyces phytophilus TaxID=722715 RepID=UPI0015F0C8DE|nr:hypothetical protein [Streptomyces phytophilus]